MQRTKQSVLMSRVLTAHSTTMIQRRTIYPALPNEKRVQNDEVFPWRTMTIPQNYKSLYHSENYPTAEIHVATYNPLGKALKPPQPIVFIPGLCTNHRIFDSVARELNYPYGLLSFDLHTRGKSGTLEQSDQQRGTLGLRQHVYDLMRVLKAAHQSHSFLVAHGYGGLIAYVAMSMFPHRIGGVVLLDSGFTKIQSGESGQIPQSVLNAFEKELEVICASDIKSSDDLRNALLGSDSSKWWNQVDVNAFAKYTFENRDVDAMRNVVMAELHALTSEMPTLEEVSKWRHPLSIVRAEKGIPFGDAKTPLLDEKTAKSLQQELNVKDKVVTLKGESHYSMLFGKQVGEVSKAIEQLVSRYDLHHRIVTEFEGLKEETPQQRKERLDKMKKEQQAKQ